MLDWNEFSAQSKKDWIAQVEKELKNSIDTSEKRLSYAHSDDLKGYENPILLKGKNQSWLIRERFHVTNPLVTNKQILEALSGGVQDLYILTKVKLEQAQLEDLFSEVHLEMVQLHWKGPFQQTILNFFQKNTPERLIIEWNQSDEINDRNPDFIMREDKSENDLDGIVSLFKDAIQNITSATKVEKQPDFKRFNFLINSGIDYAQQIALIRAIRLVWANIVAAYDGDPKKYQAHIIATIGEHADINEPNTNLIRFTIQAMSGIIGGADAVEIFPSNGDEKDAFRRRISRNIHHLLKMESFLDKVADPAAGSYAIQLATKDYCTKIWEALK